MYMHSFLGLHAINLMCIYQMNPSGLCCNLYIHMYNLHTYILTIFNIYSSSFNIWSYAVGNFTSDDITIVCISYCDCRNTLSSTIRWSIAEPMICYWKCPPNNVAINLDIKSTVNVDRCSYFNSLVASCNNRWSRYIWPFINDWWIYYMYIRTYI